MFMYEHRWYAGYRSRKVISSVYIPSAPVITHHGTVFFRLIPDICLNAIVLKKTVM
jgi:hypothetical protein